jgi:(1->4)-alpha-D-glucan 1-alpha-D-glucosylmutase
MAADEEPAYTARISGYMLKAMREAKVFTSWLNPSEPHERAMERFVESVLAPSNTAFRQDFVEFQRLVARCGIYNSLAQLAIKIGAPGIPDFYQGTELWDFSLVDPDNRRPVDYALRRELLGRLDEMRRTLEAPALAAALLENPEDPMLKLFTTTSLLQVRQARAELFRSAGYDALQAEGAQRDHLFAFRRADGPRQLLVLVPRLVGSLVTSLGMPPLGERTWSDTRVVLPEPPAGAGHFVNLLTGACVRVTDAGGRQGVSAADIFQHFPVAFLEAQ